ncbi:MAG: HD domain-containing phosphohydrolase [Longimicrobiales bacterium]
MTAASVPTATADRAVLLHGTGFDATGIADALEAEGVGVRSAADLSVQVDEAAPAVLILDRQHVEQVDDVATALDALPVGVVVVAYGEVAERATADHDRFFLAVPETADERTVLKVLQGAFRHAAVRQGAARMELELEKSRGELEELNQIGMALMTERDPDRLLRKILDRAMSMTGSDGGSLYLVEDDPEGDGQRLRFKLSETQSLPDLPAIEFTLPIDQGSIAGYVAVNNQALVIEDAYSIPESAPYSFNRGFDQEYGYRAKSMLVVPMADHRDEVVGVLQLINRKRDPEAVIHDEDSVAEHVLSYGRHEVGLVRGLAGQAAVSIENARLYEQIEDIFEAFVRAAVAAIDQRDPTTAGHSVRVAALTTRIAEVLPRLSSGRWAGTRMSREQMKELRYAALLHDFGKVGVREQVLVKAKKLPPHLWERVDARFDVIHRTIEREYLRRKLRAVEQGELEGLEADPDALDQEVREKLQELEEWREAVHRANEPSILPEEGEALLNVIAGETFENVHGQEEPFLHDEEHAYLSIPKGSLNERERKEIESHVTQTYNFLTQIPWTEELSDVATIAYGHHEKLSGRGYPRGVGGDELPVQTRMMTIADIFDALTASDRPYKKALGADRALEILEMEAGDGDLDRDLVGLFIESKVYEEVLEKDWREL